MATRPDGPGPVAARPAAPARRPGPALLVRRRLVERLAQRWEATVTLVVAGAGFGKTVALAQAHRAHTLVPAGLEIVVAVPRRPTADALVAAVERAGAAAGGPVPPATPAPPADRLRAMVEAVAPRPLCLVLDDAHLLDSAPGARAVVDELLTDPPAHLHLVLSARRRPGLRLARLRAAGAVDELGEDDLRLTLAEVAALTAPAGAPSSPDAAGAAVPAAAAVPADLDAWGGWPALVRLAVEGPAGAAEDFLVEEAATDLDRPTRRALVAALALGRTDADTLAAATDEPAVSLTAVPLTRIDGDWIEVHPLWQAVADRLLPPGEAEDLRRRALALLRARGRSVSAGDLALRVGDREALAAAARTLVRATLGRLPLDVADRWLAGAPRPPAPEIELLALAAAHRRRATEPAPGEVDAVLGRLAATGRTEALVAGLALAVVVAEAQRDTGRLMVLADRARAVPGSDAEPVLRLLVGAVDASVTSLCGDHAGALALLERATAGFAPEERGLAVSRLHWHLLMLLGRAGEAAALAERLPGDAPGDRMFLGSVARWLDGDVTAFDEVSGDPLAGPAPGLGDRGRCDRAALVAVVAAAQGRAELVGASVAVLRGSRVPELGPGNDALAAVTAALDAVVRHDEAGAALVLDGLHDRLAAAGPAELALALANVARAPAVPYVLRPAWRAVWDDAELGPSQARACATARLLVDARAGRPLPRRTPVTAAAVVTSLPLSWSVELAARAAAARRSWGMAVAELLADRWPAALRAELDRLAEVAEVADPDLRAGVEAVRGALPVPPDEPVRVEVLGPLRVLRGGRPVESDALRRGRVRELLSLLAVERVVGRERALDVLWPDRDPDAARANLRVTLTHLHKLVEPDRPAGTPPYVVRVDGSTIRLTDGPGVSVDLWEVERHLAAERTAPDETAREAHRAEAVARWRGRPLPDLDRITEGASAGEGVELRLVDAALRAGEQHLLAGRSLAAGDAAARVLAADPFGERAHRLALAAALQAGDIRGAEAARRRLDAALEELGVPPEPATAALVDQARHRFGDRG